MAEHPNAALVRRGYEAFSKGDMATLSELFSDNIVWHSPGTSQVSGDYKGRDTVFSLFGQIMQLTDGSFQVELHDVVANDQHAVALHKATGTRGGKRLDDKQVNVFHIKDGKVTEVWGHAFDLHQADAFWS